MALSQSINLVRDKKPNFLDQFINWALTIGRALVVITEMIAIGAFLMRFGLDRQLVDLHDKIVQDQNIIRFAKKKEDLYRNLDSRLNLASNAIKLQDQTISLFQNILDLLPTDAKIKNLNFSSENMRIEATFQSVSSFAQFTSRIKEINSISQVSLDKIENKTTTGTITVSTTVKFKKQIATNL